jgi:hypothetical protein
MDMLVLYDEVVGLLANPPSLAPHLNFTNLRALHCHLQCTLQHLSCPQSNVLGWSGLFMFRPMYQLLSPNPFRLTNDLGPQAFYYGPHTPIVDVDGNPFLVANGDPRYAPIFLLNCATQAMINASFVQEWNYWLLYQNIKQARYNILNNSIGDAFKFSPDPDLTGWNPSMEIKEILKQFTNTYSRPTHIALLQNDTLFRSVLPPGCTRSTLLPNQGLPRDSDAWE